MSKVEEANLLTEVELELMLILWEQEECTVHEVLAALPAARAMAYTSASTIIRILERKGFVGSRKQGKGHIYYPELAREEYESRSLGDVMGKLFNNAPVSLVARLVDDHELSAEEIQEIKKILDSKE